VVTPTQRRAVVTDAQAQQALPLRRLCRYLGVHRALLRYQPRRDPQVALHARLQKLAVQKPRWSSPRLTWRLRRDGWCVNEKRVARLLRSRPGASLRRSKGVLLVRPAPQTIVCDNGPEFTRLVLDQWARARGITLDFIRPGRPGESCFIESFTGKLRDERLNQHHFVTLGGGPTPARALAGRVSAERPHRGLGQRTPAEFAVLFTPGRGTPHQ
jgi:transposase InsO family protein